MHRAMDLCDLWAKRVPLCLRTNPMLGSYVVDERMDEGWIQDVFDNYFAYQARPLGISQLTSTLPAIELPFDPYGSAEDDD